MAHQYLRVASPSADHPAPVRLLLPPAHRQLVDTGATILDNSITFKICFGILLLVLILTQLKIVAGILSHRQKPSMRLSQPAALVIFLLSGIFTTASCYLILPSSDASCALRNPLILVSLSLSGSTAMARAWRVDILLCPALDTGADIKAGIVSNGMMKECIGKTKSFLIKLCDRLIGWQPRCGMGRWSGIREQHHKLPVQYIERHRQAFVGPFRLHRSCFSSSCSVYHN